ncbi:MAG: hypothetical protein JNM18_21530 [Planctomycetaceae bacterium]|nr:hypothetical protein [Planctomycetaceae bacterium]
MSDVVSTFHRELRGAGDDWNLQTLEVRSRLTARLCQIIFTDCLIEQTIHRFLRSPYLFFPLTPVGLHDMHEPDLSRRSIVPFGIAEPLLWLLQANGYPMLR